jgi:hypothetical protein
MNNSIFKNAYKRGLTGPFTAENWQRFHRVMHILNDVALKHNCWFAWDNVDIVRNNFTARIYMKFIKPKRGKRNR